jgi:hypothetical protein
MSYTRQIGAQPAQQGRVNPAAFGQEARAGAEAAGQAAEYFGNLSRSIQQAQQVSDLNQANTAFAAGLGKGLAQLEQQTDPSKIGPAFSTMMTDLRSQIGGSLTDARTRSLFEAHVQTSLAQQMGGVIRLTTRRTVERGEGLLDGRLAGLGQQAAANPEFRDRLDQEARAAIGGAVAAGIISADKAQNWEQRYFGRLDTAEVMGLIARNPVQAMAALADANRFTGLDPVARARLSNSATQALTAQATRADVGLRQAERADARAADEAEKAFHDAMANGKQDEAAQALAVLRARGRPGAYAQAFDRMTGAREPAATPAMNAWLESRLFDRGRPLTRAELEGARAGGNINDTLYATGVSRLQARENERFREAEQFIERSLEVPSATIPDSQLQPWQREAKRQGNQIVNDLMIARRANPDLDPVAFVQQRMAAAQSPEATIRQQRAVQQMARLPEAARTPEGLDKLAQELAAYLAYQGLGSLSRIGTTTVRPPVVTDANGTRTTITAEDIARWRQFQTDAGGVQPGPPGRTNRNAPLDTPQ